MPARFKPTALVKWDKKQEPLIAHYVKEFLDILDVDQHGHVSSTKGFSIKMFRKILSQNIELTRIRELDVQEGLIQKTLFHVKKHKRPNVHSFRRSLASEVRRYTNQRNKQYTILLPFHTSSHNPPPIRQIQILGIKFQFSNWGYVKRNFEYPRFLQDADMYLERQNGNINIEWRFVPVLVKTEGRNAREAFNKVAPAFDLMRAIFALYHHYGTYNEQWGGYPRPLAKVLPSPVYGVFKKTGEFELFLYNTPKIEEYDQITIGAQEIKYLRDLARRFKKYPRETDTYFLILESLYKYAQAHETNEWRLAFLLLWQILELITLQTSEQLSMKNVINRVGILLNKDKNVLDLLPALYVTRNELVHLGNFPDEQGLNEVSLMKSIAERTINQLFSKVKKLPTKASLQRYYDHAHAGATDSELTDRQRIIGVILRERKPKK